MTAHMTAEEIERGLIAQGVPGDKARALAAASTKIGVLREAPAANFVTVDESKRLDFPIRFTLPWSALCSDNRKYGAVIDGSRPKLIHTAQYRAAKAAAKARAKDAMNDFGPLTTPLALSARVYVPDNRPGHDVANFAKCAHDAFEDVIYTKDELLHDVRWRRVGMDVDRPRAEIEIAPLNAACGLVTAEAL